MLHTVFASDPWQDQHTAITPTPESRMEALAVRSRASAEQGSCSQDYLFVVVDDTRKRLAFCVCDGVSSSFAGHIAAQYLAHHLTPFLLERIAAEPPGEREIEDILRQWAREASILVSQVALPPETNAIVREVLEDTRTTRGSETVFLAGVLCWAAREVESGARLTTPAGANGAGGDEFWAYAMGNVRGVMTSSNGARTDINAHGTEADRWATGQGPIGTLVVEHHMLSRAQLRIGTDGIEAFGDAAWQAPASHLMRLATDLRATTDTDDLAILDLWWRPAAHTTESSAQEK